MSSGLNKKGARARPVKKKRDVKYKSRSFQMLLFIENKCFYQFIDGMPRLMIAFHTCINIHG